VWAKPTSCKCNKNTPCFPEKEKEIIISSLSFDNDDNFVPADGNITIEKS
jgi:hypothetical protein